MGERKAGKITLKSLSGNSEIRRTGQECVHKSRLVGQNIGLMSEILRF